MTKLNELCMRLEKELHHVSNVDPKTFVALWKLNSTLEDIVKYERKLLTKTHAVGYSDVFPELDLQMQILPGRTKDTYDQNKIRSYIGQDSFNQLATVSRTAVTKMFGPAEADKIFALSLTSSEQGDPTVDVRPITKKTLNVYDR